MGDLLYRVVDERSLVKFDPEAGFVAADIWTPFDPKDDPDSARFIIELHSDWSNRTWTPLISMTDSDEHALRLACSREEHGRIDVHVAIIDRELLESHADVYRMLDLVNATGAEIAPKARSWREYVCIHHIPLAAIINFITLSDFEEILMSNDEEEVNPWNYVWGSGEESSSLSSEEEDRQRPFWEGEEWSDILDGEDDDESRSSLWSEEYQSWSSEDNDDDESRSQESY